MEKVEVFYNEQSYDISLEHLNSSPEMQRYNFHKGKTYPFQYATKKETETHVYWSYTEMKPRFENGRLFYSRNNKYGATFEKKTKKFKIWFGVPIYSMPPIVTENILNHFQIDWYKNMSPAMQSLINASMLGRMIKGKITNPRDYVKSYLKTSPYRKQDVSIELFYRTFSTGNINSPKFFRKILEYSTNINHALELIGKVNYPPHYIVDLYDQAATLDRRVNPKWSQKRMNEVHTEWTREIMGMEIKSIKPHDYEYSPISLPTGISLILNNYELFEEGTTMKHCVYTNYENRIRRKDYFAFRYDREGIRATVGVRRNHATETFVLDQMYGIGNSSISEEHKEIVKQWLEQEYVQKWFSNQIVNTKTKEPEPTDEMFLW